MLTCVLFWLLTSFVSLRMQDLQAEISCAAVAALNELHPVISPSNVFYVLWPLKCTAILGLVLQS